MTAVKTKGQNPPLPISELEQLQSFVVEIADSTRKIILELWHGGSFEETLKDDQSPVTALDLAAEKLARHMIVGRFPGHGIIGEEYAAINPDSNYQWTLDPIDGTQNLVNRIPTFGTLIGLRFRGQAILGVIDHPVLNLRTTGGIGLGVSHNGTPVSLLDVPTNHLTPNDLVVTNCRAVFDRSPNSEELFAKSMSFHPHTRIYYDCYAHTLALLGSVAVVFEPNLKIWDVTPVEAMMAELGGTFINFGGGNSAGTINALFGKSKPTGWMNAYLEGKTKA